VFFDSVSLYVLEGSNINPEIYGHQARPQLLLQTQTPLHLLPPYLIRTVAATATSRRFNATRASDPKDAIGINETELRPAPRLRHLHERHRRSPVTRQPAAGSASARNRSFLHPVNSKQYAAHVRERGKDNAARNLAGENLRYLLIAVIEQTFPRST